VTFQGKILDGRNRSAACTNAGVKPRYVEYEGDDPLNFIIRKNLRRRHLNESQRAMIAAEMANLGHGGDRKSEEIKVPTGTLTITQDQAAEALAVSPRSVKRAKKVKDSGDKVLIDKVKRGEVSVSAAAKQVAAPPSKKRPAPEPKKTADPKKALAAQGYKVGKIVE
jgi:hypothetical protein